MSVAPSFVLVPPLEVLMRAHVLAALASSLLCSCFTYVEGPGQPGGAPGPPLPWVLSADAAASRARLGAVVLDARPDDLRERAPVARARALSWQQLSEPEDPRRGELLEDLDALSLELRRVGVSSDRDVIVLGDPLRGWGEAGRVTWSLRALGHERVALVDGGAPAFIDASVGQAPLGEPPGAGDFVASPVGSLQVDGAALRDALGGAASQVVLLDTRERREYEGQTPYGESRGGHVPGAAHLYFKELLDDDGFFLPPEDVRALLAARGASPDDDVVAYCTGGVRSAFVVVALRHVGFERARNYPASMWEWSAMTWPLE